MVAINSPATSFLREYFSFGPYSYAFHLTMENVFVALEWGTIRYNFGDQLRGCAGIWKVLCFERLVYRALSSWMTAVLVSNSSSSLVDAWSIRATRPWISLLFPYRESMAETRTLLVKHVHRFGTFTLFWSTYEELVAVFQKTFSVFHCRLLIWMKVELGWLFRNSDKVSSLHARNLCSCRFLLQSWSNIWIHHPSTPANWRSSACVNLKYFVVVDCTSRILNERCGRVQERSPSQDPSIMSFLQDYLLVLLSFFFVPWFFPSSQVPDVLQGSQFQEDNGPYGISESIWDLLRLSSHTLRKIKFYMPHVQFLTVDGIRPKFFKIATITSIEIVMGPKRAISWGDLYDLLGLGTMGESKFGGNPSQTSGYLWSCFGKDHQGARNHWWDEKQERNRLEGPSSQMKPLKRIIFLSHLSCCAPLEDECLEFLLRIKNAYPECINTPPLPDLLSLFCCFYCCVAFYPCCLLIVLIRLLTEEFTQRPRRVRVTWETRCWSVVELIN